MKNVVVKELADGTLEVTLLILDITTYAKDMEDVKVAVDEAVESLKIHAQREGCLETFQLIKHFLE